MQGLRRIAAAMLTIAGMAAPLSPRTSPTPDLAKRLVRIRHAGSWSRATTAGQRLSPLTQITPANASQLAAQWTFQTGVVNKFEATPIVIDGMLYVTGALNHAWAIDGRTGKQIWHYQRTLPDGPEGLLRHGESRLCRLRRSAVHGDARRASRRARDEDRQGDLGHRDGDCQGRLRRAPARR